MKEVNLTPFTHRPLAPSDELVVNRLIRQLVGCVCHQVWETYAEGVALGLGPKEATTERKPPYEVASWGCDLVAVSADGERSDSRLGEFDCLMKRARTLVGNSICGVSVDFADLSLTVEFSNGISLAFLTDSETEDLDQWFVIVRERGYGFGVDASRRWYLESLAVPRTASSETS